MRKALDVKKKMYPPIVWFGTKARKKILAVLMLSPDTPMPSVNKFVKSALGPAAPYRDD